MEKRTILVVCGAGFATSTVGAKMGEEVCKQLGFKGNVQKRMATQAKTSYAQLKPDVVLLMTKPTKMMDFGDTPVVNGIPLITGKGKEEVRQQLIDALTR